MNPSIIIFIQTVMIAGLICICVYQRFIFVNGTQRKLREIARKLKEIQDKDTDEKVMVFTENKALVELAAQINRLLADRQKVRADFRRAEESSKKMLSNISHDIKTPLTVILGYIEIMRLNDEQQDQLLMKVEKKAKKVMEMMNQFFTLAKLEAGDMNLALSTININEICRENVLDFYEILSNNHFEVEIKIPEKPVYIQSNQEAVHRILFNLISNVIRYGGKGRYLGIILREEERYVRIDVVDKGKGIEAVFAKNIFERLFTMEDSRNRDIQGNGLGLTIAKNLAEQLGGAISLESEPDVRTVFSVKLPKKQY